MSVPNAEILDAAKLVFADEDFSCLEEHVISDINHSSLEEGDPSKVHSGSTRVTSAYDPVSGAHVDAVEIFAVGEDEPGEVQDWHGLVLYWDDDQETACSIDLDNGSIKDGENRDIDLSVSKDWRVRILGVLAVFNDKSLGF